VGGGGPFRASERERVRLIVGDDFRLGELAVVVVVVFWSKE
jgi:hypothetical protein